MDVNVTEDVNVNVNVTEDVHVSLSSMVLLGSLMLLPVSSN